MKRTSDIINMIKANTSIFNSTKIIPLKNQHLILISYGLEYLEGLEYHYPIWKREVYLVFIQYGH